MAAQKPPGGFLQGVFWSRAGPAIPVVPHPAGYLQPGKESSASGGSPPGAKWIQPAVPVVPCREQRDAAPILRSRTRQVICSQAKKVLPAAARRLPGLFRAPGGVPTGAKCHRIAMAVVLAQAKRVLAAGPPRLPSAGAQYASGGSPPGAKWIQPALVQLFSVASCVCSGKDGSLVQRELSANAD